MQPIIIGLDPGTTSAFAALSVDFKILKIKSRKDYPVSEIISDISKIGIPIIVGTDKKDLPGMIKEFSQKTGAKIHLTSYDTKKDEKKSLVKNHGFNDSVNNAHEIDSLAAAIYAYNDIKPLLEKIEKFVISENKLHLIDKVILKVILEEKSIKNSIEELELKPEKKIIPKAKIIPERIFYEEKEKKIEELNEAVDELESYISELKEENRNLLEKRVDISTETKKIISFKEQRALNLEKHNRKLKKEIAEKEKIIQLLNSFISSSSNKLILKRLNDLTSNEFSEKEKILNLQKGDILYVKDLSKFSRNVIEKIRETSEVVIYENGNEINGLTCIKNEKKIEKNRYFALISKEEFEKLLSEKKKSKTFINDILEDYKKERLKKLIG